MAPADSISQSKALDAAGADADANGGPNAIGEPVACPADSTGPLWVRLDLTPDQAANDPGSLRLNGAGYDASVQIAGNFEPNPDDNTVDIVFRGVPVKGSYTLTYSGASGPVTLVQGAAYGSLQDDSLPPASESAKQAAPEEGQ